MKKKPAKEDMKCGEVRKSDNKHKKIDKKYCIDGKEKIVSAGDTRYPSNHSDEARKNFKARHKCDEAKPGTPKHLACTELWKKGGSVKKTGKGKPK